MYCIAKAIKSNYEALEFIVVLASEMFDYDFIANGRNDILDLVK